MHNCVKNTHTHSLPEDHLKHFIQFSSVNINVNQTKRKISKQSFSVKIEGNNVGTVSLKPSIFKNLIKNV